MVVVVVVVVSSGEMGVCVWVQRNSANSIFCSCVYCNSLDVMIKASRPEIYGFGPFEMPELCS